MEHSQAAQTLRHELKMIDERLAGSQSLMSDKISAADIVVFPLVQLLLRAASKEAAEPFKLGFLPLAQTFPNLARWVQRVEALPNYQRTYRALETIVLFNVATPQLPKSRLGRSGFFAHRPGKFPSAVKMSTVSKHHEPCHLESKLCRVD